MPATNAPAQLPSGTGTAQQPQVSFTSVIAQAATAAGAAGLPATNATSQSFPARRLGIRVDLYMASGVTLNANQTFESGISSWTTQNGATLASSSAQAHSGTKSMSFTPDGATAGPGALSEQIAVSLGVSYTATGWFYSASSWATGVRMQINWYNAAHTYLSTSTPSAVALSAATWTQASVTDVPPATAAFGQAVLSASGTPGAGQVFFADDAQFSAGGSWLDITQYVLQRNSVQISGMGRADWTATIQAAQLTLTLDNRDGRFTPRLATGAYFPNIVRNCPIRVFLSATSSSGQSYAGFRYHGEVAEWPLHWDPSHRDVSVDIVASGIWRRVSQQQTTLGSAFRRYVDSLAGPAVQAYWPCEDGTGSGQLVPFGSPAGTQNALQQFVGGQAGLSLASESAFPGSDALPTLNGATIIATVPAGGTPTNNVVRFGISVPAAGDSGTGTTSWNLIEIDTAGTIRKFEMNVDPAGTLTMAGRNSGGAIVFSGTTTTNVKGQPYLVSLELTPSGGNVAFALRIIKAGASGITESVTGTLTTASVGAVTRIQVSRALQLQDTAFGQLYVYYGSPPSMVAAATALNGYQGEKALDRFTRICAEQGIATETIGTSSSSAALGPQLDDTISNVLQSIEDTDCGLLYETKDQFGLGYRTNASMANQAVAATLNYTAAVIDTSLAPAYDDSLSRNNITITNWTGFAQQAVLTSGAMSILNPPSGIGNGYGYTRSVNAAADSQVPGIATFLLNVGASDEIRFPVVSVKMVRASLAPFFASIPGLDIGDYFQITNPPSFLAATAVKQLVWGYSETLNAREWTFAFNCVPETPWETGVSPGTVQTAQIPGGSPVSSQASGQLGLAALIANGSITPSMLSAGITVHSIGGNAITVSFSAPATPNTGDIWINATTGLISQWNGSTWAAVKFDASQTIIAGTIIGSNIAASTLTASLIAAGQVYAGFVDATVIQAAEFLSVSTDTLPDYLAYQGSIATGNLITSMAPAAGTDTVSNDYPAGIMTQQLTLVSQASAPPAFTGASQLYTATSGRLRYLSQSGVNMVLDRSQLNNNNLTMTTQTIPTVMSQPLNYIANEAAVVSEYEIEIDGRIHPPTTLNAGPLPQFSFDLFVDGAAISAVTSVLVGNVPLQLGWAVSCCLRYRFTIDATGAGGSGTLAADGVLCRTGVAAGATSSQTTTLADVNSGLAFDTTSNHTLAIYCNWQSTFATGHNMTTYRTRITRRN